MILPLLGIPLVLRYIQGFFKAKSLGRKVVLAIDQGTSSSRVLALEVSSKGQLGVICSSQREVEQLYPQEGYVEQDPGDLFKSTAQCIDDVMANLAHHGYHKDEVRSIGLANQRETTVVWDSHTGEALHNAIVWLDARTRGTVNELRTVLDQCALRDEEWLTRKCGLKLSTYFSAVKLRWLLDNIPAVSAAAKEGRLMFGTVDSWLIWRLTGGLGKGVHVTDITNASRTMLMNIHTHEYDRELLDFFGIQNVALPAIKSSAEPYGSVSDGACKGIPITGCLGDQQAALVGHGCYNEGDAKSTYGTGVFMLYNTGRRAVISRHGLLTTIAYKLGPTADVAYALEGSVAIGGVGVRWLRDNLQIIDCAADAETLAASVPNTGDVYFVPAFSGLFAPHWSATARGTIVGMTQFTTKAHIARAMLEAVCFQTQELCAAMKEDCGIPLQELRVDGGMTANKLCMQTQADVLDIRVVKPAIAETTAVGAAVAACIGAGIALCKDGAVGRGDETFTPRWGRKEREKRVRRWARAVEKALGWLDEDEDDHH